MNWFRQNRWLGAFLIVFAGAMLLALLFLWRARSGFEAANARLNDSLNEQSRLERLSPFPSEANFEKTKVHLGNYSTTLDKVKEELKTRVLPVAPLAPNEFQAKLRQVTASALDKARGNNVKLPPAFHLGFDEYTARLPEASAAPLLGQELSQIALLLDYVIGARVDAVTTLKRMPIAEERGLAAATPAPKPGAGATGPPGPKMVERNIVDLAFSASPPAARTVLNQIASSSQQFYIIRTLYVHNQQDKGPPREEGAKAQPSPAPNAALKFIVGTEHLDVSARIEMLRFTF